MSKNVNFTHLTSFFSKTWRDRVISQPDSYLACKDTLEIIFFIQATEKSLKILVCVTTDYISMYNKLYILYNILLLLLLLIIEDHPEQSRYP